MAGLTGEYSFYVIQLYLEVDSHPWLLAPAPDRANGRSAPSVAVPPLGPLFTHSSHRSLWAVARTCRGHTPPETFGLAALSLSGRFLPQISARLKLSLQVCAPTASPGALPSSPCLKTSVPPHTALLSCFTALGTMDPCLARPRGFPALPLDPVPPGKEVCVVFPAGPQHLQRCSVTLGSVNERAEFSRLWPGRRFS